jgi:transcription-repair coupling factor (superfamily II helicase)
MRIVFIRDVEDLGERLKVTTTLLRDLVRIAERKAA